MGEGNELFTDLKGNNNPDASVKMAKINEILNEYGSKGKTWMHNYKSGTKYELYNVPLLGADYGGLKFRDVVMILYQKMNIFLIALEVKILN